MMHAKGVLFSVAILLASLPTCAMGQRGYTARTAEYLAGNSDLIVRGRIAALKFEAYVPRDDANQIGKENFQTVTVVIDVTQNLKGVTDDQIEIQFVQPVSSETLPRFQKTRLELFWFLDVEKDETEGIEKVIPRDEFDAWGSIVEPPDLTQDRPPIMLLNVDLLPLTSEEMVEHTIRKMVEEFGDRRIGETRISISQEIASRTGMHQAWNAVLLPANYKELQSR